MAKQMDHSILSDRKTQTNKAIRTIQVETSSNITSKREV